MAKNNNLTDFLTDVANAIREKKGTSALIDPQDFSDEIASISGGGGDDQELNKLLFWYTPNEASTSVRTEYHMPNGIENLRSYAFYRNVNPIDFYFNEDLEDISNSAFYQNTYFRFPNFSSLTHLTTIGDSAFYQCRNSNIDFTLLPSSISTIGARAFQDCLSAGMSVHLPALTSMGQYTFYISAGRVEAGSLTFDSNFACTTLPSNGFAFLHFNSDLVIPSSVRTINSSFSYGGSFNSITIPATCTRISARAFGSATTDFSTYYDTQWIEFKSATPPTIETSVFATQIFYKGARIYVPDEAVDAYKAVANLSQYADYILPVSEKP